MTMLQELMRTPVVPVFYHADAVYAQQVLRACYDGGLRFFEFTNRGEAAPQVFAALADYTRQHCPGLHLGIGTIFTPEQATHFLDMGAEFVVQPVITPAVGAVCRQRQKPWIPGATTANEIWNAWQSGATLVKVFPGNLVGPDYIRALRGPIPDVPLMVTGGVEPSAESIQSWLDAGVQATGIGSQWFTSMNVNALADFSSSIKTLLSSLEIRVSGDF